MSHEDGDGAEPLEARFRRRYQEGDTPWDIGRPDANLARMVREWPIPPGKALEVGCGTGDNAIWLAAQGFAVTALDISSLALDRARDKAARAGVGCALLEADIFASQVEGGPFAFAFDRGCLHLFDEHARRKDLARRMALHLQPGGLWLSLLGNADEPARKPGPPRRRAADIVLAVEEDFEILSLVSGRMDSNISPPPRAWFCLMRRRAES